MSEQFQPKNRGGGKLNTQNTHTIHTLSWLDRDTSIKRGGV